MFSTTVGNAKYSWAKLDNEWLWTLSGFSLFKQANSKWNNKFATFKWWSNYFQFCSAKKCLTLIRMYPLQILKITSANSKKNSWRVGWHSRWWWIKWIYILEAIVNNYKSYNNHVLDKLGQGKCYIKIELPQHWL